MEKAIDFDFAAKVEKAIAAKYGADVVENPRKFWTIEKEEEYLRQSKEMVKREAEAAVKRRVLEGEILADERLFSEERKGESLLQRCPKCNRVLNSKDIVYLRFYDHCYICSIKAGDIK